MKAAGFGSSQPVARQTLAFLHSKHPRDHRLLVDQYFETETIAQVASVLESGQLRIVPCSNWRAFKKCGSVTQAAVMVATKLDPQRALSDLLETAIQPFPCPLLLVTTGTPENLVKLASIRVTKVVLPDEVPRLVDLIRAVALHDGRLLLRESICEREMHVTLKRALLMLIDLPLPDCAPHQTVGRFPRTVGDIAMLSGVTADHLRHLAVDANLPLGQILHRYASIRALEMVALGVRLDSVAERFGYESASGIRRLIKRNLGVELAKLRGSGILPLYAEIARRVRASSHLTK